MENGISTYMDFSGNGGFTVRLYLEEEWDVVKNISVVSVTSASVRSETYRGTWYPGGSVSINGTAVCVMDYNNPATHTFNAAGTSTGWASIVATGSGKKFPWPSGNIAHNNDGSKSVTVSVNIRLWRSNDDPLLLVSGTKTLNLTTIPRVSTVVGEGGTLGDNNTITIERNASTFLDTVVATCGSDSITIAENTSETTLSWMPPVEWAANNTNGESVPVVISCTSYSNGTKIGTNSTQIDFAIPPDIVPFVDVLVEDLRGYAGKYGGYVQNQSIAKVQVSAEGVYGSTITEYRVISGGIEKIGASVEFDIPTQGNISFTAMAKDTRGRISKKEISVSVIEYADPTAVVLSVYRSDENGNQNDEGSYASVMFKANISPLNDMNSARYSVKYRVKGRTAWNTKAISENIGYAPEYFSETVPANANNSYELCVTAADDFTAVTSIYRTVGVAFYLLSVNKTQKSVGIGQKATDPGMCAFGIPAIFNAGILADGKYLHISYNESIGAYVLTEGEAPPPDVSGGMNIYDDGAGNVSIETYGSITAGGINGNAFIEGDFVSTDDGNGNVILEVV